jgi:hypothetical protein
VAVWSTVAGSGAFSEEFMARDERGMLMSVMASLLMG